MTCRSSWHHSLVFYLLMIQIFLHRVLRKLTSSNWAKKGPTLLKFGFRKIVWNSTQEGSNAVKLLGVTLDVSLSWEGHVADLRFRLCCIIFLMRRFSCVFYLNLLKHLFCNLLPYINYSIELWGNSTRAIKIFKWQK